MAPQTRYARVDESSVAYQVFGDGPIDLVFVPEWTTHLEVQWEDPVSARFLERLGSFARVIVFDKRGVGLSDALPPGECGGLDVWMEDMQAVLEAARCGHVAVVGTGAGGPMAMLFAASHPECTTALVCCNSAARFTQAPDYPIGFDPGIVDDAVSFTRDSWGTGVMFSTGAPSLADSPGARDFHARLQRVSASPGTAAELQRVALAIDTRAVLPTIQVPTMVVHRAGDRLVDVAHGRYLGDHIPDAKYVEIPGDDHLYYAGDNALLREIQEFLTGAHVELEPERVLATVLFTDIVGSTDRAVQLGDKQWRRVLDQHDAVVRQQLELFRGHEVDTTGDGFFATFDGPARALRCAVAIREALRAIGIDVRIGVHTGEVEIRGEGFSGIGVHIGARVGARAEAGEVLVTRTVTDLVAGSGIEFVDRGRATLKGVPGEWELAAVAAA